MAINVNDISFGYPGGETLFFDTSFKVDTGQVAGLIGDNGLGKSTLLQVLNGELEPETGTTVIDGTSLRMPQMLGRRYQGTTVRRFLAQMSGSRVASADEGLGVALRHNEAENTPASGTRLALAFEEWAEVGGYELEAQWDAHTMNVLRQPFSTAANRPISELSGGERKRLALELLLRSAADVLLLDEPDNFLDIPAKRWLEQQLDASGKTILLISHDRELLSRSVELIITLEGSATWTHGGSFSNYHEARDARNQRLGDTRQRWEREERRLYRHFKLMKQRAAANDAMASRANAAETRWQRFTEAGPPPPPPPTQRVSIQLRGADSGRRVIRCKELELLGLTDVFSVELFFGERVAVIGPNGSGKSHFVRLLGGEAIDIAGEFNLGARVEAGLFTQTNERPEFAGGTPLEAMRMYLGAEEAGMRALARYGLHAAARQRFETLSGGQQARLQILALELGGANLLLLDEPTDNLDLVSAEALQEALVDFTGTVVAVTHDRWFMRNFDRYLMFDIDGSVREAMDYATALGLVSADPDFEPRPGSLRELTAES